LNILLGVLGKRHVIPVCIIWNATSPVLHPRFRNGSTVPKKKDIPPSLMRSTQSHSRIAMEKLIKMYIIPEMRVEIQLGIPPIGCTPSFRVTAEYMNNAMLDLFGDMG